MKFKERRRFCDVTTVTCDTVGTRVEAAANYPGLAAEITGEADCAKREFQCGRASLILEKIPYTGVS